MDWFLNGLGTVFDEFLVPKRGVTGKGMIYEKGCFTNVIMMFGGVVGCMLGARQREKNRVGF